MAADYLFCTTCRITHDAAFLGAACQTLDLVLPVVHRNGTGRDALIDQRCAAGRALRDALGALAAMAPHGRDYYPVPGRMELALAQYKRRIETVRALLAELEAEAEALADEEG